MMSETGVNITRPSRAAAPIPQPGPALPILAVFLWGGWLVEFVHVKGWLDSGQDAHADSGIWSASDRRNCSPLIR
jgi:hypothetical protein